MGKSLLFPGAADISIIAESREVADQSGLVFTLSCNIENLSAELTDSKIVWKKNGTDVRTLSDGAIYTPEVGAGSYDNNTGTQTSTLTVSGSDSTRDDMEFVCEVTDPADNSTTENATVYLKFYSMF